MDEVKTVLLYWVRDKFGGEPVYCPSGVRHKDGMTLIQAFARNVGCAGRSLCYLAGESPVRLKLSERAGSESCERHGNRAFEA